jgi:zinc protease
MTEIFPEAWKSLPGPEDITRVELENGITVLSRSNFDSPSVVVTGYMDAGTCLDPDDKLGLAHFTAAALMRGTEKRSFQQIYDELESAGASLGFGASVHNTGFGGRCLVEDLPLLLSLFTEVLRSPAFPEDQVERLRDQIMASLTIRAQDTWDMASMVFDEILFAGHPYARPDDGNPETIEAITIDDLHAFAKRYYGPKGMVIVVVGGISAGEAVDRVQKAVGDWQNSQQVMETAYPDPQPLEAPVRRHIALPGKSQTDLLMGSLGPKRRDPEYLAASIGNNVFGQFGMMGRIGDVVREQAGLAYHASASLNAMLAAGSWEISAGVNPANLQRAIDLIRKEVERFIQEPVSSQELQDTQDNYIGRLPLTLESNGGVANSLLNLERFQLGLDYYRRLPSMIRAVTAEEVLQVARSYLHPHNLVVVSSGPALDGHEEQ